MKTLQLQAKEKDFTLEEYTDYIKGFPYQGTPLRVKYNGRDFEIFYVPIPPGQFARIEIAAASPFQLSGNNVDGVVVTLWRNPI